MLSSKQIPIFLDKFKMDVTQDLTDNMLYNENFHNLKKRIKIILLSQSRVDNEDKVFESAPYIFK